MFCVLAAAIVWDNGENKEHEVKNVFHEIESHIFVPNFGTEKLLDS